MYRLHESEIDMLARIYQVQNTKWALQNLNSQPFSLNRTLKAVLTTLWDFRGGCLQNLCSLWIARTPGV